MNGMLRHLHLLGPRRSLESGWTRVSAGVQVIDSARSMMPILVSLGEVDGAHEGSIHVLGAGQRWHTRGYSQVARRIFSCQACGSVRERSAPCPGAPSRLPAAHGTSAAGMPRRKYLKSRAKPLARVLPLRSRLRRWCASLVAPQQFQALGVRSRLRRCHRSYAPRWPADCRGCKFRASVRMAQA